MISMSIWAIADLHLSFGVPEKSMEIFGTQWLDYSNKLRTNWLENIDPNDLVLIPGDVSWAMDQKDARVDLEWIDALPGTKVMIKGNHDYWWHSITKVQQILPPSIHVIQNNAFHWNGISVAGSRLWDSDEFNFDGYIEFQERVISKKEKEEKPDQQKIFNRELERLELSLKCLDQNASLRIAMTHYPPISADLKSSKVSALLEKYRVEICVFGHLHSIKPNVEMFGERNGIHYLLTACDYLDFKPVKIYPSIAN